MRMLLLPETPTLLSQRSTSSLPSDYLGSTPTSEQIRENPFNPTNQTSRLPYWTTHSFTQGEPNLINDPIDISTDTTTSSSLPETLSLPSTPSISQIAPPPFNLNFPNNLDARYREQSSTNIPLRLDWNTFTAPPPLFGQHPESNRLHNWALKRLQYRQDIHEDIRDHNIQILQQNSLQLKFEITVKLNSITQHPYPLNPPNITAQSLPPPFITTEVIYKYDRYTKKTIGYITFYNPYSRIVIHMYILKILIFLQLLFLVTSNENINPSPRTGPQDLLVTHYDCEENEQKTLHKYAINRVSQCETEPQAIETTNVMATLYSKARATTVLGYKFTATFSEKKVHCSQVSNGNKNRLDHESFYQSNIERLLHLNPEDCKNELLRLNITRNKDTDRKISIFPSFCRFCTSSRT